MIFYALLPTIPKVSFINTVSLVAEENKQNYSTFGYIGGGLAKKSTYITGNASNYSSVWDGAPNRCFDMEQPCRSNPFNLTACYVALSDSNVATKLSLSKAILFLAAACLHAFKNTPGWNNSDKSNSSSLSLWLLALSTHCFNNIILRPNLRIQSKGSSHSE